MSSPSSEALHPLEPTLARLRNPLLRLFVATRPAFLSVTLVACLIGLASAHASGVSIQPLTALLTILLALLVHAAGNVLNDYFDALSGADELNTRRLFPFTGGSRLIQNGVISTRGMGVFGCLLLLVVIPPGLWLAADTPGLIGIGMAGMVLAWAYTAPPLKLVCRGLGEIVIFACWLLVVIGADHVQRGSFDWMPLIAGAPFALLVANLLFINQFPDHDGDTRGGKLTLVVRLGPEQAKWLYFLFALIAHLGLLLAIERGMLPQVSAIALLTLVMSLHAGRMLRQHASIPEELGPAIKLTIAAALLHGMLLAATLAFNWRT